MSARSRRKRQTRLDFSPLPDSSPAKAAQPEAIRGRVAAVVLDDSSPARSSWHTRLSPLPTPEASSAVASRLPLDIPSRSTSEKTSFMLRGKSKRGEVPGSSMRSSPPPSEAIRFRDSLRDRFPSESDSDDAILSPQKSRQRRKRAHQDLSDDQPDQDELASSDANTRRHKRAKRAASPAASIDEAEQDPAEDEDEDVVAVTPKRRRRKVASQRQAASDLDSDVEETIKSTGRRRKRLNRPRKRRRSRSDDKEDEQGDAHSGADTDDQDDNKRARKLARKEEDDLKEDLEFLAPSDGDSAESEDTPRQSRPLSAKKSAKQQALEALKRRRQQSSVGLSSDAPIAPSDDHGIMYDVDDQEPTAEDWTNEAAESGDDWIVDEDNDEAVEIPAEFRLRTAKPKVLFRIVVDWCVQKQINPGFDSRAAEYDIAFKRLSDFVNGLGGSKYQSSAWTATFRRGLLARPLLQELHTPASVLMYGKCDACNRSGHPASYEVKFQGSPYNKESLEDFSDDEDETGQETEIPDANRVFYIGKVCMRNARVAHQLHHWRYHLNSWIVDYLEENSYLDPAEVLKRDRQSTRKRGRAANRIVDSMEKKGDIKNLYRDFKHEIDAAQSGEGAGSSSFDYDSD